jgi:hypothetical protein
MFAVTAVALARLHGFLGLAPAILRERPVLVINLMKLALVVSSDIPLASACVD